jgi:uncharacterized protein with FMN-binding domain
VRIMKIILFIFGFFALIAASGMFYITRGLKNKDLVINPIDLNKVKDGSYEGEFKSGRFSNKVKVVVVNHKITSVKIIDDVTFNLKEKEDELLAKILKEQSNDVDIVAGSSVTSKAILKSVELALQKGVE